MEQHLYYYDAIVQSVCDGRTCIIDVDLGLGRWSRNRTLRLARIIAPKIAEESYEVGMVSRDFLKSQILSRKVRIQIIRNHCEKSCLAEMWLKSEENGWINVNDLMVNAGQAVYKGEEAELNLNGEIFLPSLPNAF